MKSKQILTLLSIFIFAGILSAQSEKPFRFGVIGGMNLSNVKADLDNRVGFHAGVKAEYALPLNFYLESGLLFTQKGYKVDNEELGRYIEQPSEQEILVLQKEKGRANKYMLELPIHVGYKLKLHNVVSVFGSAGGYLGYGMSGRTKGISGTIYKVEGPHPTDKLGTSPQIEIKEFKYKTYDIEKRFDWGLGLKAGVELFDRLQISASYDWGMNKLYSETSEGNNRNFMVSCAFMIF